MGDRIKGVIFDNDNTLAKVYPGPKGYWLNVFSTTVKELGGSLPAGREEEYMLAYYSEKDFSARLKELGLSGGREAFQAAKMEVDARLRLALIQEGKSHFFPDALELIRYLDRKGIGFGVATFTSRLVVMAAFDRVPGLPRPAGIFGWEDSREKKLEKPDPRIARIVLEQMGVKPENAMMVGDRLTDVELGNRSGMISCLLKREDEDGPLVKVMEREIDEIRGNLSRVEDFDKVPDFQVSGLAELIPIIEGF